MAFIPGEFCSPLFVDNDSARWFKDVNVCSRRIIAFSYNSGTATVATTKVTDGTRTLGMHTNFVTDTTCGTVDSYYYDVRRIGPTLRVHIDPWLMYDDGLWTSSIAFTWDIETDKTSIIPFILTGEKGNYVSNYISIALGSSVAVSASTPSSCTMSPTKTYTVTVFDDGSITVV